MINKGNGSLPGQEVSTKDLFSDEKTDHKIRQHISDINDVISEQDIKNVKTDFYEKSSEMKNHKNIDIGDKDKSREVTNSETEDSSPDTKEESQRIETPWNILGS